MTTIISLYDKPWQLKSEKQIALDLFLEGVKEGKWQDEVIAVRKHPHKSEEQLAAKKKVTSVTISGKFIERKDDKLEKHSGFVAIDIDNVEDINALKNVLRNDRYVVACFVSISGKGLCVIFKIVPAKHKEAFRGVCEYLFNTYNIVTDPTSVNPSRARFVSWDPDIYINDKADKFTIYPEDKEPKKVEKVIYSKDDFGMLLEQIVARRLNVCENYHEWLRVGFGLAHKFGDAGRQYFHVISQFSPKYDPQVVDRQYTACLNARGTQTTTLATLYYYCKQMGLELYGETTKTVVRVTAGGKRAGLNIAQISKNLAEREGITGVDEIIQQAFDGEIHLDEDTLLDELEAMLREQYSFRRNEVTRYVENRGKILKQKDLNTIYLKAKKKFEKLTYDLVERLINSDFVPDYNPFIEFFEKYKEAYPYEVVQGTIEKLLLCIETKDSEYLTYFGTKWLVGMISAIYGTHSPLQLILTGDVHGTGKTEYFRRMLPKELKPYYAESKLVAGKDDDILMTQKLLIMDDEMAGKSKTDYLKMKNTLSKQVYSLREPYGKNNVDLVRLAVLGATTNEDGVIDDPTGNRRVIPIHVYSIDNDTYNSIDKIALMMEAYWLYHSGFVWEVKGSDIARLNQDRISFEVANMESELIQRFFEPCTDATAEKLTASDIKVHIEDKTRQKLSLDRIGKELKRLGFTQTHVRTKTGTRRCWLVKYIIQYGQEQIPPQTGWDSPYEEPPF